MRRGWVESRSRHDEMLDLKFSMQNDGVLFNGKAMKNTIINHCRGEKCITCKTDLIETLADQHHMCQTWFADTATGVSNISIDDFSEHGVDSYFPKCFIISNTES